MTKIEQYLETREPKLRCSISVGNMKMGGDFPSFSFPPIASFYEKERICVACGCNSKSKGCEGCYAKRMYARFKQVAACYEDNYYTWKNNPGLIYKGIEAAMMMNKVFRFFVSGDIPNLSFFENEIEIIKRNPECQVIQFTKKYDVVNEYIEKNGELPSNLHLIFSAWKGLQMSNPFLLPECHVIYTDGTTTASDDKRAWLCSGNCTECYLNKGSIEHHNCFNVGKNEQILIKAH